VGWGGEYLYALQIPAVTIFHVPLSKKREKRKQNSTSHYSLFVILEKRKTLHRICPSVATVNNWTGKIHEL
jgi:hypothetical protein